MGILSGGNFADLLEPGLRAIFDVAVSRPRPQMEALYGVQASTKFQERYLAMGAVGLVPVFSGTLEYLNMDAGYRTDIRNYVLAAGMQVERELVDDDQYNEINGRAQRLGDAFAITVEHDAVQTFINAFTDSGTTRLGTSTNGADGVGLCSTAHPYSPAKSGSTQSNESTLTLSLANVDTTRQGMRNFVDDQGNLLGVEPDTCLVPSELERDAIKIFGRQALYEPDSAEFNVNMFAGQMRVIVWNRLTDANAWFLLDTRIMRQQLIWQWRFRPEFLGEKSFDGLTAKYRGYMRYGLGHIGWQWIYGQNPS